MATAAGDEFDTWLIIKLQSLNTDENVFSSYIKGILEGDETEDEKNELLEGIISGITEDDISQHCQEIIDQWKALNMKSEEPEVADTKKEDVDDRLVKLLENQAKPTIVARSYTEEEKKLREAILAQYSHMSDQEDEQDEDVPNGVVPTGSGIASASAKAQASGGAVAKKDMIRNTNFEDVMRADKERRDKAKQESQQKKLKDKEDREKQKQAQQEKKEKRKTQKGERRR